MGLFGAEKHGFNKAGAARHARQLPRKFVEAMRKIELSSASAEEKIAAYNVIQAAAAAEQAAAERAAKEARAYALGGPHIIPPPIKKPLRRRFPR